METFQAIMDGLTWQATFAILGSIIAIVTGYFGYLIKVKQPTTSKTASSDATEIQRIHTRVSEVRDRLGTIEGDARVNTTQIDSIHKVLKEQEDRHLYEVRQLHTKLDKVTDIVMKILSDDNL